MERPLKIWILAPALLGLSACTQHPDLYARYEPAGQDDIWVQGMRMHKASSPAPSSQGLEVTSGFVGKTLDYVKYDTLYTEPIRFSVRVENTGDSAVLIEPTRFRLWAPESSWAFRAMDPEKVIQTAEGSMRRDQDEQAASVGVAALVAIPLFIAMAATEDTEKERKENRRYWKDMEESEARAEERQARKRADSEALRNDWSTTSLRKTTLFPGKEVHGLVSFLDDSPFRRPDTLSLQYELTPGRFLDLGRYGKIVDTAAIRKREEERKKRRIRPETTHPF